MNRPVMLRKRTSARVDMQDAGVPTRSTLASYRAGSSLRGLELKSHTYASILRRVVAGLIDRGISTTMMSIASLGCLQFSQFILFTQSHTLAALLKQIKGEESIVGYALCLGTLLIFADWAIMAAFESSILMATPGKLVAGICIVNEDGRRLTFWQSINRSCLKITPLLAMIAILLILNILSRTTQLLSSLSVSIPIFVIGMVVPLLVYFLAPCWVFFNRKKQTLFDTWAGVITVRKNPSGVNEQTLAKADALPWFIALLGRIDF